MKGTSKMMLSTVKEHCIFPTDKLSEVISKMISLMDGDSSETSEAR